MFSVSLGPSLKKELKNMFFKQNINIGYNPIKILKQKKKKKKKKKIIKGVCFHLNLGKICSPVVLMSKIRYVSIPVLNICYHDYVAHTVDSTNVTFLNHVFLFYWPSNVTSFASIFFMFTTWSHFYILWLRVLLRGGFLMFCLVDFLYHKFRNMT